MATTKFARTAQAIAILRRRHRCFLMKISTEDESLTHDDVRRVQRELGRHIEIELKIGGPTAAGDLLLAKELRIRHIIAPMVESSYAVTEFLRVVRSAFELRSRASRRGFPSLGVNIETSTAYTNLASIIDASADSLKRITVGRSDLSRSLGTSPDNPRVTRLTRRIVFLARRAGCFTSVGGGIHPGNIAELLTKVGPDGFNTRNFAFRVADFTSPEAIKAATANAIIAEMLYSLEEGTPRGRSRAEALRERVRGIPDSYMEREMIKLAKSARLTIPC